MCAKSWTRSMFVFSLVFGTFTLIGIAPTLAVEKSEKKVKNGVSSEAAYERVNLFEALERGDIEVKFVPKDSSEATVFLKNKLNKPLSIELPPTFAATPVLKQMGMGMGMGGGGMGGMGGMGMGGMGGMGGGGMGGMGGGQGMGGGMGGMGGGGMGGMGGMGGGGMGGMGMGGGGMGGMGGGFFNLGAEKNGKIKVNCVCLEHGKKEPNHQMKYELKPIESFTTDANVIEICRMVGAGAVDQKSAQAAAWHYTDKLSWDFLASKVGYEGIDGSKLPMFNRDQLSMGMKIAAVAASNAEATRGRSEQPESKKPSTGSSYGQPVSTKAASPIR